MQQSGRVPIMSMLRWSRMLQQCGRSAAPAAAAAPAALHTAPGDPDWASCGLTATSDRASTVCVQGSHTITIDAPVDQGGHDAAPGPVAHFLGSLIGAQQASLYAVAQEQKILLGKVTWTAEARIDARGVLGDSSVPAEFDRVRLVADVESNMNADRLAEVRESATQRCIVANTLRKAGVSLEVVFNKKSCFQEWSFQSSMGTHIP